MNKVLAVMIAGLFAAGAYAQPKSAEVDPTAQGKPAAAAAARQAARPAGQVKPPAGDTAKVPEGSGGPTAITEKAQARRDSRDMRRPDKKTGGKKAVPVPGGTPEDVKAK